MSFVALLLLTVLPAQEPDTSSVHPEARSAIDRLWSPYCPGLMLEVCPSPGGEMLRDSIESLARSGVEADSIVELILAEYGEEYRAVPEARGVGGLAWYVPPLALLAGLVVVAVFLLKRSRSRLADAGGASGRADEMARPLSEADERRLRDAMEQLDRDERPDF